MTKHQENQRRSCQRNNLMENLEMARSSFGRMVLQVSMQIHVSGWELFIISPMMSCWGVPPGGALCRGFPGIRSCRDSQPVQIKHLGMTWWWMLCHVVPLPRPRPWNLPKQRRDGAWWSCTRQPAWTSTHKLYVRRWEWRTCALVPRFWMFKESQNHVYHYCIFRLHKQLQLCGQKISKISSALQMLFSHVWSYVLWSAHEAMNLCLKHACI